MRANWALKINNDGYKVHIAAIKRAAFVEVDAGTFEYALYSYPLGELLEASRGASLKQAKHRAMTALKSYAFETNGA